MLISKFHTVNALLRRYLTALKQLGIGSAVAAVTLGISFSTQAAPVQYPLFIANPVKPIMMLNMSKDHQLFYKLYDDYSDIINDPTSSSNSSSASSVSSTASSGSSSSADPFNYVNSGKDGKADTTYNHRFRYYGYFDSDKCYTYADNLYSPSSKVNASTRYCNNGNVKTEWSGNFLNWASMTRLDAVRKILYGGKRAVDDVDKTILERSYLPEDAHAFAKYYNGDDIRFLTPFGRNNDGVTTGQDNKASGITMCNSTSPSNSNQMSHIVSADTATNHPLLKVAKGNFSLWSSNEGRQCRWGAGTNGNNETATGIKAHSSSPQFGDSNNKKDRLGLGNYSVRVRVCVADEALKTNANEEGCKLYSDGHSKPIGLLQEYGENDAIHFALMTGSYGKNKSGGVLRKNAGSMTDEINLTTGQFINPNKSATDTSKKDSIIRTLNALTIYGYNHNNGAYNAGDNCALALSTFENGSCSNWGNPQSEMFLESLRYLAGKSVSDAFNSNDSGRVTGLATATWAAPVSTNNYCAPLNILQFNASTSSYDTDELTAASDVGIDNLNTLVDAIGTAESISGQYFVGVAGANSNELCTPKTVTNLSSVKGTCPDAPRLGGGYQIAGLAYGARKDGIQINGLPTSINGNTIAKSPVHTYAVALAPAVPKVEIPVPGNTAGKTVTILPACRNTTNATHTNCAIVDFKIVQQTHTGDTYTGKLYVDWEDSEQGSDYDQDMWGLIEYEVTSSNLRVNTRVFAQSASQVIGFGYVVGGTDNDGFHVQSGINDFRYGTHCSETNRCTCTGDSNGWVGNWQGSCKDSNGWKHQDFPISSSSAANVKLLELPLYYAAKWGGYADDTANTATIQSGGAPTYYYATDPRQLAASLRSAFNNIAEREGSSSGVATNSTSLSGSSYLYQAVLNSANWRGTLEAYAFDAQGRLVRNAAGKLAPAESTDNVQPTPSSRNIFTYRRTDNETVNYLWNTLNDTEKDHFRDGSDAAGDYTKAEKRFNWSRGSATDEVTASAAGVDRLRSRGESNRNIYGDIVNSTPVYIGNTNFRYHKLTPANGGSTYQTYLTDKAAKTPKVAVGANDGMLHVFNANTLAEIYAYVPKLVFPKLRNLSAQNYGRSNNPHQYLVDGPLTVGDVYNSVTSSWHTIIVGTLGGGGRGVFALDVTDDTNPKVLFEISDADFPQLGYVLGKPLIAPLKNNRWGIIFGNGDSSGSSTVATQSHLFVVDVFSPLTLTKILPTGSGRGLSAPAVLPDANGVAKAVYAGDLNGQLWKFDLSSATSSEWDDNTYKLFHAKTADSTPKEQPITAAPTLGINKAKGGKIAVYFGTGKYYEEGDQIYSSSNPYHSFYAITDIGSTVTRDSSSLVQKTFVSDTDRRVQETAIDWSNKNGWFLDLGYTNGERVVAKSLLIADRLVFPTVIPSTSACEEGGDSWLLETSAVYPGGAYVVIDGVPTEEVLTLGPVGVGVTEDTLTLLLGRSDGNPDDIEGNQPPRSTGRQSWRELD